MANDLQTAQAALTIPEFCRAYRMSRSTFYNLAAAGQGPRTFRIGTAVRVSVEAADEWRRKREAEAANAV